MGSSGKHASVDPCRKASGFKWKVRLFLANENEVVRKLRFVAETVEKARQSQP